MLASVSSETLLCWADPSCLEPGWTWCLREINHTNVPERLVSTLG
ncbi:hypothetical protein A6R68_01504 [Neotoma lepida]|uniref:Uncharacterized protein n=1 Tax=Neotoma lepida TaxID=56216 RepID=A0A1A6GUE6_NEOLE|nr:hypothetical protein A6R68_01504 [Neotoma lepida]